MIIVADSKDPFEHSPKGSPRRHVCLKISLWILPLFLTPPSHWDGKFNPFFRAEPEASLY
ncbi:hypothetical protein BD414DRAFT_501355 [Trametes punicea]|nr:hypothetical protein BD414DRAFT_501355 [Trametes punicea]